MGSWLKARGYFVVPFIEKNVGVFVEVGNELNHVL